MTSIAKPRNCPAASTDACKLGWEIPLKRMNRFFRDRVYNVTMKVNRVFLAAISAVAVSSCAYDPYYAGGSYSSGPSYASDYGSGGYGYGSGYGYGGRNFTTTYFVSTGHSRWGYDPYARCYYDYSRRSYYDPYLNGYYPVGYRPRYVQGAPHPHGWRSGSRYIAPPSRIHDHRLDNYQNRSERYRSLNNSWSRNVEVNSQTRGTDSHHSRYDSREPYRGSTRPSYFGSSQEDQRSRTGDQTRTRYSDPRSQSSNRSRETYVNELENSRRPESRTGQSKQESSRFSRPEQTNQTQRQSGSNRQVEPNQDRGGRRNESVNPEVMRQPENRGAGRTRSEEKGQREQPSNRSTQNLGGSL